MATRIYRPTATASLGGMSYPVESFEIRLRPNSFAQASVTFTSNEKNGGRFSKEEAVSICKQLQSKVLAGGAKASLRFTSGAAGTSFNGTLTGCNSTATARGGLRLSGSILAEDAAICSFDSACLIKISNDGLNELTKKSVEAANKLQINTTRSGAYAILATEKGGDSLSERLQALLDIAIKYARKYPPADEKAASAINSSISRYNVVKQLLQRSHGTSKLFNGKYTLSTPQENIAFNSALENLLFRGEGANFWEKLQIMFTELNMLYCPNISGRGRIMNQDFDPASGGDAISGSNVTMVGTESSLLGIPVEPANQVSMEIPLDKMVKTPNKISIVYPESPDPSGGSTTKLAPKSFFAAVRGSVRVSGISAGRLASRVGMKPSSKQVDKEADKLLKNIVKAGTALCRNTYYFLKYSNSKARAEVYYSGGNVYAGSRVSIAGFKGVLSLLSISGGSTTGVKCSALLSGVVL